VDEGYALDERLTKPTEDDMWGKDLAKSFRTVWTPAEKNFFGSVGGPYMIDL
jgi:hypothetical protein